MNETEELLNYFEKKLPKLYNNALVRQEQVQFALDVEDFLFNSHKKILFIDAPVGTGKSMGVLIPALIYSRNKTKGLLYATATISLQNQIMKEEVPKLKKMNLAGNALLAMGKNNYTCRSNYEANKFRFSKDKRKKLNKYFIDYTKHSGQLSEIETKFGLSQKEYNYIRMKNNVSNKNEIKCKECFYKEQCSSIRHRKLYTNKKRNYDITVTNHDQMIISQKLVESNRNPIVPMDKGIIIVDEAHLFLENYLGRTQEEIKLNEFVNLIGKVDANMSERIKEIHKSILKKENELQGACEIPASIYHLLTESIDKMERFVIRETMKSKSNDELINRIEKCESSLKKIINKNYISWIDLENRKYCAASKEFLSEFSKFISNLASNNKVIFMSGTLTGTKKREEITNQWGISALDMDFHCYETPFDYAKQAKIYIPSDIALPNNKDNEHLNDISKRIQKMIEISSGNSLILCTSKHYMFSISEYLKEYYQGKYTILTQEDKSVEMLTKEFKSGNKILVGSGSFFTGFSIAGKSLTSVIITKLPFPTPDNPIIKLIGQNMDKQQKFDQVILPMMFNKLYQAVGRLIRDIGDYGIISILDPRIHINSKYGDKVLFNLSDLKYDLSDSFLEICEFYGRVSENGTQANFIPYKRKNLLRLPVIDTKKEQLEYLELLSKYTDSIKIRKKVLSNKIYSRQKNVKELRDETRRKEKIHKIEVERKELEKQRSEIRESIKPLENFRKKWGLKLFTQNQKDKGVEKCFFSTIELIRSKVELDSQKVIEDLFKEFPFLNDNEEKKYRNMLNKKIQ